MTKYVLMLAAAGLLVASPSLVKAEDHAGHADHAATTEVKTETTTETTSTETTTVKEVTLEDGTKVSVEGDVVSVVAADGTKTPAPDGEHKDTEGHVWTVKDGKLVK
jgi:uncharacterized protein YdeI (BOF family)